ncbi:hypothetical protein V8E54_008250 [Elaphomyces granulatus]|jgi:hypothetical protein
MEYEECRAFLEDFLAESGLLGKNISTQMIRHCLMETLRTKDHNEVPSAILNSSASDDGMRGLVGFSLVINNGHKARAERFIRGLKRDQQTEHEDQLSLSSAEASELPDETPNPLQRPGSPIALVLGFLVCFLLASPFLLLPGPRETRPS